MLEKTYDSASAEPRIAALWDEAGAFKAGAGSKPGAEPFCIVIPPPNVTGSLHMGHALNNTLQDILARFERMRGKDVLWQPGMDHAGIATQMVVERRLTEAGANFSRREMGREAFVEKIWEWKAESGGLIFNQLKRLGASCDWSREKFTMGAHGEAGDQMVDAVTEVFVRLYNEGLIYKDKRLVNWDTKFETAISDLEVENIEVDGFMWHFKYPLAGGETYEYVEKDADGNVALRETRDYISIATTRPETMLGDGAVAVHPSDERYRPIIGKLCEIPVGPKEHRRLIPIITDEYPDKDFGSGAVKITGAHDQNDYGVAKRNGIPMYRLMDTKGAMREDGSPYSESASKAEQFVNGRPWDAYEVDQINLVPDEYRGLDRFEARKRVVADIDAEGLMIAVESKKIMQPFGDRSNTVIEPMLTDQWYVNAQELAKPAIASVREGRTKIVPENWDKTYFQWMENIQPWCISRQLWWGHQIPVWYGLPITTNRGQLLTQGEVGRATIEKLEARGEPIDELQPISDDSDVDKKYGAESGFITYCAKTKDEAKGLAEKYIAEKMAFLGLEEKSLTVVEVDKSQIDFLAIRNGTYQIDRDEDVLDTWFSSALWPFSTLGWPEQTPELKKYYQTDVLVTGFDIIFFWVARMMMMGLHFMKEEPFHTVYVHALVRDKDGQKMSKSKGNVIDPLDLIDEYGADALRFTLAIMAAQGRDVKLDPTRIAGYRNFGTKLWNATRFAEMNGMKADPDFKPENAKLAVNRWILTELSRAATEITDAITTFRFNDAAGAAYKFVWNQLCDWHLELLKPVFMGGDEAAKAESQAVLAHVLDGTFKLLHPFMPFMTEELWGVTAENRETLLCHATWPKSSFSDPAAADDINWLIDSVSSIRSIRSEMNVPPATQAPLFVVGASDLTRDRLVRHEAALKRLSRVSQIELADAAPKGSVQLAMGEATGCLPLGSLIDFGAESARLAKELARIESDMGKLSAKLGNERFVANAKPEVVEADRARLTALGTEKLSVDAAMARLAAL
jgi:valyl-tRNA synthetase